MIDWTTQILLKWKGIDDQIYAVDQGMDDWDRAGEVAVQRTAVVHRSRAYLTLRGTIFDEV
jgi:hypothetical protein